MWEMMEKLEHEKLERLTLHNKDVKWFKKEKEIIVQSVLFDVHSYFVAGDSTIFSGLFDIKETEIKRQVTKLLEQKNADSSAREVTIAKLILQLCITADESSFSHSNILISGSEKFIDPGDDLLSAHISFPSPPPKAYQFSL